MALRLKFAAVLALGILFGCGDSTGDGDGGGSAGQANVGGRGAGSVIGGTGGIGNGGFAMGGATVGGFGGSIGGSAMGGSAMGGMGGVATGGSAMGGMGGVATGGSAMGGAGGLATGGVGGGTGGFGGMGGTGGTGAGGAGGGMGGGSSSACFDDCGPDLVPAGKACYSANAPEYGCGSLEACPHEPWRQRPSCQAGQCEEGPCLPGFDDCDGVVTNGCETDLSQPDSCGACGVQCGPGELCGPTGCTTTCVPPLLVCGGRCVDITNTNTACGSCTNNCSAFNICSNGLCSSLPCPAGTTPTPCGCRDLDTDPNNCGSCGNVCESPGMSRRACENGTCRPCDPGFVECSSGECRDPNGQPWTCLGVPTCNPVCPVGCFNGSCAAGATWRTTQTEVLSLAVDATNVYYVQEGGVIYAAPKSGGPEVLIAFLQDMAEKLTPFGDQLFWMNKGTGEVQVAPSDGTAPPVTIATVPGLRDFTVDSQDVYYVVSNTTVRQSLAGGAPQVVHTGLYPLHIESDATHIYWNDYSAPSKLYRMDKATQVTELLHEIPGASNGGNIMLLGDEVYWQAADDIHIVDKQGGCSETIEGSLFFELFPDPNAGIYYLVDFTGANSYFYAVLPRVGKPTQMMLLSGAYLPVAVGDTYMYVGVGASIRRAEKY